MSYDFYTATLPMLPIFNPKNPNHKTDVRLVILKFVVKIVGPEKAPEIAGMLIDLKISEIREYLQNFELFLNNINRV